MEVVLILGNDSNIGSGLDVEANAYVVLLRCAVFCFRPMLAVQRVCACFSCTCWWPNSAFQVCIDLWYIIWYPMSTSNLLVLQAVLLAPLDSAVLHNTTCPVTSWDGYFLYVYCLLYVYVYWYWSWSVAYIL